MKAKAILTAKYAKKSQSSQRKEYEELTQTLSAVAFFDQRSFSGVGSEGRVAQRSFRIWLRRARLRLGSDF
jgi:hypothetical protein